MSIERLQPARAVVESSRTQVFNRMLFDRQDPTEDMGVKLLAFSRSFVLTLDKTEAESVSRDLYREIFERLNAGYLGESDSEMVSYKDAKFSHSEGARKYILVTHRTVRGSRLSVLIRSFAMGDGLYLAFDSLLLGKTNQLKVLGYVLLSLIPFAGTYYRQSITAAGVPDAAFPVILGCVWALWLGVVWSKFLKALRFHGEFKRAFAESFVSLPDLHSFNSDDVMFFFKSVVPLVVNSARDVFERRNIPMVSLDEVLNQVNSVSINTQGGQLIMNESTIGIGNHSARFK